MNRGFTLVEMVLVGTMAALVGGALLMILVNNNSVVSKQSSLVNVGVSLNDSLHQIDDLIRQASVVAAGYPEVAPAYFTGAEVLVLKLPSISSSGTIEGVYDYMVISKQTDIPQILHLRIFPDSEGRSSRQSDDKIVTTLLQSIKFTYYDSNRNEVSPTAASAIKTELAVKSQTGSVGSNQTGIILTNLRN